MKKPVCLITILLFIAIIPLRSTTAEQVRLQLKWYHQAQFTGCSVAKEKKFDTDQGLDVIFIEGGPGINPALAFTTAGSVDITPAYYKGGLIKLYSNGEALNIIYPGDYRVRFYSDSLLVSDRIINENPDLVYRFISATLKGWQYAIENIEECIPMILKYARIKNPDLRKKMFEAAVPLIHTGEDFIGWMKVDEWEHMYHILQSQGIINTPIDDLETVFTNQFVKRMHKN